MRTEEGTIEGEEHNGLFNRMLVVEDGERVNVTRSLEVHYIPYSSSNSLQDLWVVEEPRILGGSPPGPPCCTMCHVVTAIGVNHSNLLKLLLGSGEGAGGDPAVCLDVLHGDGPQLGLLLCPLPPGGRVNTCQSIYSIYSMALSILWEEQILKT